MLSKFSGFFDPSVVDGNAVHIIGCGAIGSTLALQLTRCGINEITLWDFDTVAQHNLANQQFLYAHIGMNKVTALHMLMTAINPQIKINIRKKYTDEMLSGYVFMCVDSIDVRKTIVKTNKYNTAVLALFDFRMRLKDAQHYGTDWSTPIDIVNFENTMDFTQEEADAATPVNACGMTMSIIPTIETVVATGVANFINYLNNPKHLKKFIMVNPFDY